MSNYVSFLVLLVRHNPNAGGLIKIALKIQRDLLSDDCVMYYAESDSRDEIMKFLPPYLRDCIIVGIYDISDVVVVEE